MAKVRKQGTLISPCHRSTRVRLFQPLFGLCCPLQKVCASCLLWFTAATGNQSDTLHLHYQVEKLWLPLEDLTYNEEQRPFSFAGVPRTSSFPRDLLTGTSSGGFILQIYSNMPVSPEPLNVFINIKPRDIRYSPLIHRRPFFNEGHFFSCILQLISQINS